MKRTATALLAVLVSLVAVGTTACTSDAPSNEIKLGVVDVGKPHWKVFTDVAKEHGYTVKLVSFSDYNAPNPALADESVDLNQFQHVRYLATYNVKNTVRLTPVGATQIYPLQLYSKRHRSIDALPQGATIALSDNPANQIRPLLSLKAAGLVTFRDGAGTWQSSLADVDRSRSKVTLVTLDPTQIGPALDSVDAGFVDDTFAVKLGLTSKDSIYTDDPRRPDLAQYVNVFAARENDPRTGDYTALAALYHDQRVHDAVVKDSGETAIFTTDAPEALRATLARVEQSLRS
ncbi:MetQ/NlpA family ABC transporter substrate-binding protein [Tsukamurella ocularis]|uniref:MetQ/NlpA family ABC transporter substrate-binding protein n=1 Tax=Tsukamurella ocularis TaxID=1970234 RepID=UPI002168B8E9|nr:MetQ/NlpA family ABC transporter substrate-binding protein [Tsukamurella ocularis]MCS3779648.1 D-methionine transport system substrate-binding protein [Tsukamurella ocularis]MCS3788952.1 D-methionine transport system substrate-binding protein [Tsukamurella ocularis]MCS3850162.1 D-methionine transport system substrate-binding protein [Tsukamurella ocularis]